MFWGEKLITSVIDILPLVLKDNEFFKKKWKFGLEVGNFLSCLSGFTMFLCECSKCLDTKSDDLKNSMKCTNCNSGCVLKLVKKLVLKTKKKLLPLVNHIDLVGIFFL